jgi:hypothetical protein
MMPNGRMTETHYYDSTNVLRGKGINERDPDGALLAQRYFDLDGNALDWPAA